MAYLKCQLLKEGIHSGGSGLVRDSFHILRLILDRIDNAATGEMLKVYCVYILHHQLLSLYFVLQTVYCIGFVRGHSRITCKLRETGC